MIGSLTRRVEGELHRCIERVFGVSVAVLGEQAWRSVESCMYEIGTVLVVKLRVNVVPDEGQRNEQIMHRLTYNFGIAAATLGSPNWE